MTHSLADHLARPEPIKFCNFRKTVEGMPPKDKKAVLAELKTMAEERRVTSKPYHSAPRLSKILEEHGYIVSKDTINSHLNGHCCCSSSVIAAELGSSEEPGDTK